jgi:HlyD family secretion protein
MSVFRKSSLDKLSSPEQLDKLVKLTSPRSWMVVSFFGLMITATLIWSVVGTIPTKIQAQGIFISSNGTNNIFSAVNGQISDVTIQKDEYVHKGDVIARISQGSLSDGAQAVEKQIEAIKNYTLDGNSEVSDNTLDLYGIKNQINDIKNQINKMKIDYNSSMILLVMH